MRMLMHFTCLRCKKTRVFAYISSMGGAFYYEAWRDKLVLHPKGTELDKIGTFLICQTLVPGCPAGPNNARSGDFLTCITQCACLGALSMPPPTSCVALVLSWPAPHATHVPFLHHDACRLFDRLVPAEGEQARRGWGRYVQKEWAGRKQERRGAGVCTSGWQLRMTSCEQEGQVHKDKDACPYASTWHVWYWTKLEVRCACWHSDGCPGGLESVPWGKGMPSRCLRWIPRRIEGVRPGIVAQAQGAQ